jgi:hypothetical protein
MSCPEHLVYVPVAVGNNTKLHCSIQFSVTNIVTMIDLSLIKRSHWLFFVELIMLWTCPQMWYDGLVHKKKCGMMRKTLHIAAPKTKT